MSATEKASKEESISGVKERSAKLRDRRAQRKQKSALSGSTKLVSKSGAFVNVNNWQATFDPYDDSLSVSLTVSAKDPFALQNISVELWPTQHDSMYASATVTVDDRTTNISARTGRAGSRPGQVVSVISGTVTNGQETRTVHYLSTLYVYDYVS